MLSKTSEAAVPTPEQIARDVLGSLLEGCQVISPDWRYLYVNDTVARQARVAKEALVGRTMMECFPGIDGTAMFTMLRRCMAERRHDRLENRFEYPDGAEGWFELRFIPVPEGVCILSLDITEAKRTTEALARSEEQLRQAQKMEAVGRLAGGVAHDFNNLLSVVLSYASLLLEQKTPGTVEHEELTEIRRAAERGAELTKQLLTFSRQQVLAPQILDLNEVIANMDRMLRRLVGADVEIRVARTDPLAPVLADQGQVEQVIMNLVLNARDAMPDGGRLTIETQNTELDEAYARSHLGVQPGPHVMLAVSDTGTGMDRETQQHIFEPFFTTKPRGKGTGLGLSTVFGIVRQSRGSVWVYSEVGKGTTFKIFFPRAEGAAILLAPQVEVATLEGTETVLLVEDEDALRVVSRGILERNGYTVLEASNGAEALRLCQEYGAPIHLLLTDVVMPEMNGGALVEHVTRLRPDIRVLYMSGYTEDAILQHRVLSPGVALLQKPITPSVMLRKVREVLEASRLP